MAWYDNYYKRPEKGDIVVVYGNDQYKRQLDAVFQAYLADGFRCKPFEAEYTAHFEMVETPIPDKTEDEREIL